MDALPEKLREKSGYEQNLVAHTTNKPEFGMPMTALFKADMKLVRTGRAEPAPPTDPDASDSIARTQTLVSSPSYGGQRRRPAGVDSRTANGSGARIVSRQHGQFLTAHHQRPLREHRPPRAEDDRAGATSLNNWLRYLRLLFSE